MPEISVIIPTFQHGDTIAACLDSVFKQTIISSVIPERTSGTQSGLDSRFCGNDNEGRNDDILEVIVVNDGSTDDTEEVLKPYQDRIIYKKIKNSGAPHARNAGFAVSNGRFVIFLDADIVMRPEMLQTLYDALKAHPEASYAYGGFRFGIARFKCERFDAERLRRLNFIHTSALIRREDFPGFDESLKRFQDWDLWLTMLEKGRVGIGVDKILFAAKPHGRFGYSQWRPKIFFSPFLEALNIKPDSVRRYREAASLIARKHGLDLSPRVEEGGRLWALFLALFALSAISFSFSPLGTAASLIILLAAIMASLKRLIYGASIMLAELIFGSLAGKTLAFALLGTAFPLRYALFAAIGTIWLIRISQRRVRLPPKKIVIGVIMTLIAVGWGIANGLWHSMPLRDVFFDANAYFALPMILIFASAVETPDDQRMLEKILKHGAIALSILTLAALYFFSHLFWNTAGIFAYKWLRDSRIAEITALSSGTYRVFIQSQIFCLFTLLFIALNDKLGGWRRWAWGIWPAAALAASGSRSFALGLIVSLLTLFFVLHITKKRDRVNLRYWPSTKKIAALSFIGAITYVVLVFFPIPATRNQASFQDMLRSRDISERDAATVSRWSLLAELDKKIMESPILGSGFGATVTYQSSDPRLVSTTGGGYTTSAFEWNYHDILVKMGIFGLLAYGFLLWSILAILLKTDFSRRVWLVPCFFALIILNIVTPYLNHPLGIGYLALLLAMAQRQPDKLASVPVMIPSRSPAIAAVPAGVAMIEK